MRPIDKVLEVYNEIYFEVNQCSNGSLTTVPLACAYLTAELIKQYSLDYLLKEEE